MTSPIICVTRPRFCTRRVPDNRDRAWAITLLTPLPRPPQSQFECVAARDWDGVAAWVELAERGGPNAPDLDAQFQDIGAECLSLFQFSGIVGKDRDFR